MQLPLDLKNALDSLFQQTNLKLLEKASTRLTNRYRMELRDGAMHIGDRDAALGYVAARFPATYAAVFSALFHLTDIMPDFFPVSQLDIGAGPGTAVFAAAQMFQSLKSATLVEQSDEIIRIGKNLVSSSLDISTDWQRAKFSSQLLEKFGNADLVTASYVLDELDDKTQDNLIDNLWQKTKDVLLLVEPGTPAGWQRLMRGREHLIKQGAHVIAPCPHQLACPVSPPDWCHFSVRVERSRIHRLTKQAVVPFEDEKYCYLACSREKKNVQYCRILSRPQRSGGKICFSICLPNGEKNTEIVTKKSKDFYRQLRRLEWGSTFPYTKP